ncbi:MAG TPA: FtsX-like permease family protein, partial [Methylococcales bacterium]
YGVTGNYFNLSPITTVKGTIGDSLTGNNHTLVISTGALKAFGLDNRVLGKNIKLNATITADNDTKMTESSRQVVANDFKVGAIVDKGSSPVAYIPAEFLFQNKVDKASELKVQMDYPQHLLSVRSEIERLGYQTSSVQDSISQVNRIFNVIRSILVVFGVITIAVTVFGTINTITVQLIEETKQIGFLRIMGIKREDVGLLFILESIILSTSGAIIGIILGLVGGLFTNGLISSAARGSVTGGQSAIYVYQIPKLPIIIILVLSVAIGWAIGILPSRRAVEINPIAALRSQ